nr:glycosyltransferase family A protein [Halomonas socia]
MVDKKEPFFSVIMPIYNKEGYIRRAVDSVINQTYQDFEIIIVCDPSTDRSNDEVANINDERIKIYHRDKPGPGGYAARNLGIMKAQGQWLAFLDADDIWYPEHLEKMKNVSENYPSACFLGSGWMIKSANKTFECPFYNINKSEGIIVVGVKDYLLYSMRKQRPILTSMCCVKRSSPVANNLFPDGSGAKRGGDLYAWLKLVCHHKILVWSNHLGGVYSASVEGQTIKSAESTPHLMTSRVFEELSVGLDEQEKKLLKKNLNRSLKDAWMGNIKRGKENFKIRHYCYLKDDLWFALYMMTVSFLPMRFVYRLYKSLK